MDLQSQGTMQSKYSTREFWLPELGADACPRQHSQRGVRPYRRHEPHATKQVLIQGVLVGQFLPPSLTHSFLCSFIHAFNIRVLHVSSVTSLATSAGSAAGTRSQKRPARNKRAHPSPKVPSVCGQGQEGSEHGVGKVGQVSLCRKRTSELRPQAEKESPGEEHLQQVRSLDSSRSQRRSECVA